MKRTIVGLMTILWASTALAASPFDGEWAGESVTKYGTCPHSYDVAVRIRDGFVSGTMESNYERITIASAIDPGGRFVQGFGYNGRTVLKTTSSRMRLDDGYVHWRGHEIRKRRRSGGDHCYGVISLYRVSPPPPQTSRLPPRYAPAPAYPPPRSY